MNNQEIIDYVMHTPHNINPAILDQKLSEHGAKADWNQNNPTAPNYVENRTHYLKDPVITEIINSEGKEVTITDQIENLGRIIVKVVDDSYPFFNIGQTYEVIINGISIKTEAAENHALGDISALTSPNNAKIPFYLMATKSSVMIYMVTTVLPETITFILKEIFQEIVPLEEKFVSYKPGRVINQGEVFNCLQADGTWAEITASGKGTILGDVQNNQATGFCSIAEGRKTTALGDYSHACGEETRVYGTGSIAEGFISVAASDYQHVFGKSNIIDIEGKYALIVGNGTISKRSNIYTLDWAGTPWYQNRPQFGGKGQDNEAQMVVANGDTEFILKSSDENSTKQFKITVNDEGALVITEIV